jgi:hypothetical protein
MNARSRHAASDPPAPGGLRSGLAHDHSWSETLEVAELVTCDGTRVEWLRSGEPELLRVLSAPRVTAG